MFLCACACVFLGTQTLVFDNSHKPDTVNPSLLTLLWTTLIEGKNREGRWSYSTRRQNHQLIQKSDSWQNPTSKRYYRPFKKRNYSGVRQQKAFFTLHNISKTQVNYYTLVFQIIECTALSNRFDSKSPSHIKNPTYTLIFNCIGEVRK